MHSVPRGSSAKIKYQVVHDAFVASSWLFLAAIVSCFPNVFAEERRADSSVVEFKEETYIRSNGQPATPKSIHRTTRLVGPSAEEIHDFLYPLVEDGNDDKLAMPAN
jgi:hypothetical protein